jgi:hypothetical protein
MAETDPRLGLREERSHARRWAFWGGLILILALSAGVRFRLLDVPLERDEGEYAYAGQLILQGIPPYEQLYSMKLPGIYGAYAVVLAAFEQTPAGIHLGLLVINAATIVLIFLIGRAVFDDLTGLLAAASFALLSVQQSVQGVFANAEHFVLLPAMGGLLLLVRAIDGNRLTSFAVSGLLLGLGLLMKQHGAAFVALGGVYLLGEELRRRPLQWRRVGPRCAIFALAAATPYLATCLLMWTAGVFEKFWFWTVTYASSYTQQVPLDRAWGLFLARASRIFVAAPLVWALAAVGLTAIAWDPETRRRRGLLALLSTFSILAILPGFHFRPHYFVLLLPGAAVLAALGARSLADLLARTRMSRLAPGAAVALAVVALGISIVQQREFLFISSPLQVARSTYPGNPFPESLDIARFIDTHAADTDRIAVLGSEPQIYFYTGRRSATGYVYTYEIMRPHAWALEMQREMIEEIESSEPEFLGFVNVMPSWLGTSRSHHLIFEWFEEYSKGFSLAAVAPVTLSETRFYSGAELAEIKERRPFSVEVYMRNGLNL